MTQPFRAALVLVGVVLAACGSDPQGQYCQVVKERQAVLTEVATSPGRTALLDALPLLRDLAAEAPGDIRGEWRQVVSALDELDEALDEAGVDPATYDAARPPADVTAEDRRRIEAAADRVADSATVQAFAGVEQHARDVCKTPLSL